MGEEYKPPVNSDDLSFLGNEKDGMISVCRKNNYATIIRFNGKSLAFAGEKALETGDASNDFNSGQMVDLNGNYYWLHSDWDKDLQKRMAGL